MTAKTELSAPKRRTRAEVQQLVAEFVSSDMLRSEFCQSRGLKLQHSGSPSKETGVLVRRLRLEIYPLYNVKRSLIGLLNNLPKRLVTFSPEVDLNDSALLDSTSFRKKFCKGTEKDW